MDKIRSLAPLAIEQDETHISYPRSLYPLSQTQMGTVHIGEMVNKELLTVCTNVEPLEDVHRVNLLPHMFTVTLQIFAMPPRILH